MLQKLIRKYALAVVAIGLALGIAAPANAQAIPQISVVTFQPGTVYWQRFGHNAIVVRHRGQRIAYNYGIFDFTQKNFMLNFVQGRMQYQLVAMRLAEALYPYQVENRWALEQQLNLKPAEAIELAEFLAWNARPENAEYRYDYFLDNCSTRVRDALNTALDGALSLQLKPKPGRLNYREQVARVSAPEPWLMLGMDVGLGPSADQKISLWQESFIPGVLMRALRDVKRADGTPLVGNERFLLRGPLPDEPGQPPLLLPWLALAGFVLAGFLLALGYARNATAARISLAITATSFTLLCAVGGWFLATVWGFTEHWGTWRNQNMLLLNPLCLLLIPLWIRAGKQHWRVTAFNRGLLLLVCASTIVALGLHLLPGAAQDNLHWIALFLPAHFALAWLAWRQSAAASA